MSQGYAAFVLVLLVGCSQHPPIKLAPLACEVVAGPDVLTLRPITEPEFLEPGSQFIRNSKGSIFTGAMSGGIVLAYDDQGRSVGTIGRPGDGPGELAKGHVVVLVGPGDTLFVRDNHRHWVVYDGDGVFANNRQLGPIAGLSPADTYLLPDGRVLSSFVMPTEAPNSIAIVDDSGTLVRAFAPLPPRVSPGTPRPRVSAYVGNGLIWVAPEAGPRDGYTIDIWDTTGTHHGTIRRDVAWFPPQPTFEPRYTEGDGPRPFPFPTIARIFVDDTGLVWVVNAVPSVSDARKAYQSAAFNALDEVRKEVIDFVVEVFDPATHQVIASGRLSRAKGEFDGPLWSGRWAYRVRTSAAGTRTIGVFELGLRSRPGQVCAS